MRNRVSVIDYIEAGLKASRLRQSVIANNIANLSTPGFRRGRVLFEEALAKAAGRVAPGDVEPEVVPAGDTPVNEFGSDVSLEMEVGDLVRNAGVYKTYLRVLGKIYRQMEIAAETP